MIVAGSRFLFNRAKPRKYLVNYPVKGKAGGSAT